MRIVRPTRIAAATFAVAALALSGCSEAEDAKDTASTAAGQATSAAADAGSDATSAAGEATSEAADEDAEQKITDSEQKASLADWDGSWKSLGAYVDDEAMQEHLKEAAEEHGETVDEVRAEVEEARGADFQAMVIGEDKINFLASADDLDGASAAEGAEYAFSGAKDVKTDEFEFTWFIFEGGEGAQHKYVLLMPLHGEEGLAHFHMRYGDTVEEALEADDEWYPTFVDPSEATDEQVAETLFHHHH